MTNQSKELLTKVVTEFYSKSSGEKEKVNEEDKATIIYNLLRGNHLYSYNTYKEIFNYLTNEQHNRQGTINI